MKRDMGLAVGGRKKINEIKKIFEVTVTDVIQTTCDRIDFYMEGSAAEGRK